MQAMPNALSSRNAGFGGPSGVAHQSTGSVASGRFSTNNLVVGLSQVIIIAFYAFRISSDCCRD